MNCRVCGAYLEEGELFCPNCGTRAQAPSAPEVNRGSQEQPVSDPRYTQDPPYPSGNGYPAGGYAPGYYPQNAPQQPKEPSPAGNFFGRVWNAFRNLFSGRILDGLREEAKSTTHEWILFIGAFVLTLAIALPILIRQLVGNPLSRYISYGLYFAVGLFSALALLSWIFLFMLLHVKVIMKRRDVSIVSLLNVIAYSTIPVTLALTAGMILGIIHGVLAMLLISVAGLMMLLLLYTAVREYGNKEGRDFFLFLAFTFAALLMMLIFLLIVTAIAGAISTISSVNPYYYYGW